jgi:hypothetical protein
MKFCPQGTPSRVRRNVERPSQAEPGRALRFFGGTRASGLRTSLRYGGIADSPINTTAVFPMKKTGFPPIHRLRLFRYHLYLNASLCSMESRQSKQ